jgi:protein-L-isoaspartate(D-aspartate) O-methyltransferase
MLDSRTLRANMVASQLRTNDVTQTRLLDAVSAVARERFAPGASPALAYREGCIDVGEGRVLIDLRSFGKLGQLAEIDTADRVLDVGCATGYSTAVLAHVAKEVVALEENPRLAAAAEANLCALGAAHARVVQGPLADGVPDAAPFNVVFMNGAVEMRPAALLAQLGEGGRLVCVLVEQGTGHGYIFVKHGGAIGERNAFDAQLPVLPGFARARSFVF